MLKHDPRPFESIEQHDEYILNIPRNLPTGDELWVLGDVAFTKQALEAFFKATSHLQVFLIRGNHDDALAWKHRSRFHAAYESCYVKRQLGDETIRLYLSHYAHRTWRNSCHGSYHLFGHSHGALEPVGRSMDVGVNCLCYSAMPLWLVHEKLSRIEPESHHARQQVSQDFIVKMEKELHANHAQKGDWRTWVPTPQEAMEELQRHVEKLRVAITLSGSQNVITEHSADVAAIAMMIDAKHGIPGPHSTTDPDL